MTNVDPKLRALRDAAAIVGEERLAKLLDVSPLLLSNWLSGSGILGLPMPVYFKAVAIIAHPPAAPASPAPGHK